MIQEMTSFLESAELRYNRSHAAPFQRHGAPPKIMPQSSSGHRLIWWGGMRHRFAVNPMLHEDHIA